MSALTSPAGLDGVASASRERWGDVNCKACEDLAVGELAALRRAAGTVATYAANAEGRRRAAERKARGGW